ncbi:hypothetical protein BDP81DRAFT_17194 [Colletotrichum phormii]|uniref:Uncharacterized protein n=1 Tax=Colletotrichum phormii TaxID=359342 RepID=A0AAJ0EM47_9PEZI|nr:uncharacterized protein BDP81DRAFT_17194 [Colletotrichum phormii]KAK1656222.1 hypothetical protein BDP81DRAFT_17194 [Colletotrichum phormii]
MMGYMYDVSSRQPAIEGGHFCWRSNLLGPGIQGDSSHLGKDYWRLAVLGGGVEFCCFRLLGMHGNLDFQIWMNTYCGLDSGKDSTVIAKCCNSSRERGGIDHMPATLERAQSVVTGCIEVSVLRGMWCIAELRYQPLSEQRIWCSRENNCSSNGNQGKACCQRSIPYG